MATRAAVPLSVWPGIPPPGECPHGGTGQPCPRRYSSEAVGKVITAFSRPGDLVLIPDPATETIRAAGGLSRSVLRLPVGLCGHCDLTASPDHGVPASPSPTARLQHTCPGNPPDASASDRGRAALAVVAICPSSACAPGRARDSQETRPPAPGLTTVLAACHRRLRPGGPLAVITTATGQPEWPGELIAVARAAGLTYTQHIVAVHAAIQDSRLHPLAGSPAPGTRHRPVHTDILIFTTSGRPAP